MSEQQKYKWQLRVVYTIVFFGFVGISIPYLIFPALFLNPQLSILSPDVGNTYRFLFLGITLAAYPLGQFIGSPILGALSDDYGRKPLLALTLFITAFSNIFTGFAIFSQHLGLLIVSRFIAGIMEGNIAIARAIAADIKTISKHETFGKINALLSIAYLIGPFLGGVMTDQSVYEGFRTYTPFFFICILFFVLAGLSMIVLKNAPPSARTSSYTIWQRINFIRRMKALFVNKQLKALMIISTLFTLAVDIFYEFGPVYLTVKWSLAPAQLIFYNGVLCIGLVVGNGWLPKKVSLYNTKLLTCGAMGGFALFLAAAICTNSVPFMMIFFLLIGVLIGLAVTLITVKISDLASDSIQGEVMGTQLSLRVLGDGMICLLGGVLLILSSKLILGISAAMALIALGYYGLKKISSNK